MTPLDPLETLYDVGIAEELAIELPPELAVAFGGLGFPPHAGRAYVIGNFVESLDGVTALGMPGYEGGAAISGHSEQDRLVMGILRAVADAVVVGAGTLRSVPRHIWTAEFIFPRLAEAYRSLRSSLNKEGPPLNVIVSEHGKLDPKLRVFQDGSVPVLVVTNEPGQREIENNPLPPSVRISSVKTNGAMSAAAILEAVREYRKADIVLVEGGPRLMGDFFAVQQLDELFLTLSPLIAGRHPSIKRLGLVEGKLFAPEQPVWGRLISVKRGGNHLFLRYAFSE